jgi:hypothetical protein
MAILNESIKSQQFDYGMGLSLWVDASPTHSTLEGVARSFAPSADRFKQGNLSDVKGASYGSLRSLHNVNFNRICSHSINMLSKMEEHETD